MILTKLKNGAAKAWNAVASPQKNEMASQGATVAQVVRIDSALVEKHSLEDIRKLILQNPWVVSFSKVSFVHSAETVEIKFRTVGASKGLDVDRMLREHLKM